ncbi:hypothetical protein [Streptomyces sp. Tue6028]|uniref:hypothetical protein n=1 Tax=Streptomyces sp. Tue6028 TaxID=2036037 RepID=UPI003D73D62E
MAATERELHEKQQALIRDLGERHAQIERLDHDATSFDEQYEQLLACGEQLLEFERLLPARLAEPRRRRTEKIVKWSWLGESIVTVALIVTVFLLGHTAWWLVLLIPHLLATMLGWSVTVTADRHKQQRAIAIGLHVPCLLVALVSLGVLSGWWITAIVIGWIAIGVASEGNAQQEAR